MSTFQGKLIADSYTGILHSEGEIPSSGKTPVYDGLGNTSSLSIGRNGNGATVSGQLSASNLKVGTQGYPSTTGSVGSIVIQETSGSLGYTTSLSGSYLSDLSPNPADRYKSIDYIDVNSKGLVTKIKEIDYINDPKLITKTQLVNNPATKVASGKEITEDWLPLSLLNNLNGDPLVPIGAKSAILFLEPIEDANPARAVRIRASRNPILDNGSKLYDPYGHRCVYYPKDGTRIGVQCNVAIGDLNQDGTGTPLVYLKDDIIDNNASYLPIKWDISVEAYGY